MITGYLAVWTIVAFLLTDFISKYFVNPATGEDLFIEIVFGHESLFQKWQVKHLILFIILLPVVIILWFLSILLYIILSLGKLMKNSWFKFINGTIKFWNKSLFKKEEK